MNLTAALIYWVIVALWLAVLATVITAYVRNPRTFGTARLLLAVVAIDTMRNIIENLYFGFYFGSKYGLFPGEIFGVLGNPYLLIIPKVINIVAGGAVLGVLLLRWLPAAAQERLNIDDDIREKSTALKAEIEERKRLFETSLDLIFITDRRGTFLRVSPSSLATLGYAPEEMVGRNAITFIHPDDLERTRGEMRLVRAGQITRNFETRYIHKDGRVVMLAWSGVWSEPEQKHFFFGRDVTERKEAEEKLKHLAHFDQLTGLANGLSLRRDLAELMMQPRGSAPRPVTIAMFDLDGFKDINDTLGHATGDMLLRDVANRLQDVAYGNIRVYRLGGDEFAMTFPHCGDPRVAVQSVDAALARLGERFDIGDQRLFIGASAGIAIAPNDGANAEELISNADLALYDAKGAGGHTHRLFIPAMRAKVQARRELETELRRALAEKEFVLYYQPQVRSRDGAVVGAEALLRWQHPQRGLLGPGAFIEAVAQSPISLELGRWILYTACATAAAWRQAGYSHLRMGVNLFPAQFHDKTLVDDIESALRWSALPADALELEITENIALRHDEEMIAPLRTLRDMGVSIAFDDFGTGYASLSYLTRYPLTRIKIDKSFVHKITADSTREDAAIVRSIIVMAHNLGLGVIAEGVETPAQSAYLQAQRCDELQGYLYAKPLPMEEFESFLRVNQQARQKARPSRKIAL